MLFTPAAVQGLAPPAQHLLEYLDSSALSSAIPVLRLPADGPWGLPETGLASPADEPGLPEMGLEQDVFSLVRFHLCLQARYFALQPGLLPHRPLARGVALTTRRVAGEA